MPMFALSFGMMLDALNKTDDILPIIVDRAIQFVLVQSCCCCWYRGDVHGQRCADRLHAHQVGVVACFAGGAEMALFNWTATRQIRRVRELCFSTLLRQEVGWYDVNSAGDLSALLAEYVGSQNTLHLVPLPHALDA